MQDLKDTVLCAKLDAHHADLAGKKICVAVSGGVDSMALAISSAAWAKAHQAELYCVTIDHHLREGSSQEAAKIGEVLAHYGIAHYVLSWEHGPISHGVQAKARQARYALLHDFCVQHDICVLLTAHHFLDQVETYYLRLQKGSGVVGLAGIPMRSYLGDLVLLRPFLELDKQALLTFCQENAIEWQEDPTNQTLKYQRNVVRKNLSDHDMETARLEIAKAKVTRQKIYADIKKKARNKIVVGQFGELLIHADMGVKTDLNLYFWGIVLRVFSGQDYAPKFETRAQMLERLEEASEVTITLSGVVIKKKRESIYLYREKTAINLEKNVIQDGESKIWDHRFKITLGFQDKIFKNSCWKIELIQDFHTLFKHIPFINRKTFPILRNTCMKDCIIFPFEGKLMHEGQLTDLGKACQFETVFEHALARELDSI